MLVSKNNDEIYAELVVTEVGAMENKMIDAAAMAKGLGEAGISRFMAFISTPTRRW